MPIEIQQFEVLPEQPRGASTPAPVTASPERAAEVLRRWQAEEAVRCERMRVD